MITSRLFRMAGALLLTAASASSVAAQQPLAEQVLEGCKSELESWCQSVTPGEGRLLACLYAHEDQLSGQCEFALYDAAARLERAINALTFVASECRGDIESLCAGVEAGEGRIIECLNKNAGKLSKPCNQAMTDVGLKK
jgi:Cysteine rich repeat